jgi:uncharacterized BrkB/YihY/UPF0761 family membrane protein
MGVAVRLLDPVRDLIQRLLDRPRVKTIRAVMALYDAAGGGLMASGLAYAGLFAVLSATLFMIGVTGYLVRDSERMAAIVGEIGRRIPPLEPLFRTGLQRVAETATSFSVIGLLGLAWGASRFYAALDDAFARVYRDSPPRGLPARLLRGFGLVGLLVVVLLGAIALATLGSFVNAFLRPGESPALEVAVRIGTQLVGLSLYLLVVVAILALVPPRRPSLRSLRLPTVVVAVLLWLFTNAFVLIQARLVGSLELFSGFAFVLATMVWLSFAFQLLLLGAAWTHVREYGLEVARDVLDAEDPTSGKRRVG